MKAEENAEQTVKDAPRNDEGDPVNRYSLVYLNSGLPPTIQKDIKNNQ